MVFENRFKAGEVLTKQLREYAGRKDVIVLAIPRGGVQIGQVISQNLAAPLDVLVLRKLGVPGHEELGFGAVAREDIRVIDQEIVQGMGISPEEIEQVANREQAEVERRENAYRSGQAPLDVRGKAVILVDDGVATGSSIRAAIAALRKMEPACIVLTVPVAPLSVCRQLESQVDHFICAQMPKSFRAISEFYEDFSQVSDLEVVDLLNNSGRPIGHRMLSNCVGQS